MKQREPAQNRQVDTARKVALLLALLFLLAATYGSATFAQYRQEDTADANARVASFDVAILAPDGIQPDDQPQDGNEVIFYTTAGQASYTFTVVNNGEVGVQGAVSCSGANIPLHSFSPASFVLAPGAQQEVTLTISAANATGHTVQDLKLQFILEQVD